MRVVSVAWLVSLFLSFSAFAENAAMPDPLAGFRQSGWTVREARVQIINYSVTRLDWVVQDPCSCGGNGRPPTGGPGLHQNVLVVVDFVGPGGQVRRRYVPFGYGGDRVPYAGLTPGVDYGIDEDHSVTPSNFWDTYDRLRLFQRELDALVRNRTVCYNAFGDNFWGRFSNNLAAFACLDRDTWDKPSFNCRTVVGPMTAAALNNSCQPRPTPTPTPVAASTCANGAVLPPALVMFYSSSCGPSELAGIPVTDPQTWGVLPWVTSSPIYYRTVDPKYAGAQWRMVYYDREAPAVPAAQLFSGTVSATGDLTGLPQTFDRGGCGSSVQGGGFYAIVANYTIEVSCNGQWYEYVWGLGN